MLALRKSAWQPGTPGHRQELLQKKWGVPEGSFEGFFKPEALSVAKGRQRDYREGPGPRPSGAVCRLFARGADAHCSSAV